MNRDFSISASRIAEGIWCFEQSGVRSFLIEGEKSALVVDALHGGDLLSEIKKVTDKPLQLVLTHSDQDHIGCDTQFGTVRLSPAEFARYRAKSPHRMQMQALSDGEIIDVGGFRFRALLIPGHTPGSIALFEEERRFIISGDSVQTGPIYMFGEGRSVEALNDSLRKLQKLDGKVDEFLSSHHELQVPFSALGELISLTDDVLAGSLPEAQNAPPFLPENVKIYSKGSAALLLTEPAWVPGCEIQKGGSK